MALYAVRMCLASWENTITGNGPGNEVDSVWDSAGSKFDCSVSFTPVSSGSPLPVGLSPSEVSAPLSTSETGLSDLDSATAFEGLPINAAASSAGVRGAITDNRQTTIIIAFL